MGAAHRAASSWFWNSVCAHMPVCTHSGGLRVSHVFVCMCETTPACVCMCPTCPRHTLICVTTCVRHRAINVSLQEAAPCCPIPGPGAIRLGVCLCFPRSVVWMWPPGPRGHGGGSGSHGGLLSSGWHTNTPREEYQSSFTNGRIRGPKLVYLLNGPSVLGALANVCPQT